MITEAQHRASVAGRDRIIDGLRAARDRERRKIEILSNHLADAINGKMTPDEIVKAIQGQE